MAGRDASEPRWLKQGLVYFALLVMIGAGLNHLTGRFIPNGAGISIALGFAAISAGVGGYRAVRSMDNFTSEKRLYNLVLRCFLGVAIMLWFGWMAAMEPLEVYTAFFGLVGTQQETSSGWRRERIAVGQCSGPDIEGVPLIASVCVDDKRSAEFQEGEPVTLFGRVSAVGVVVQSVK